MTAPTPPTPASSPRLLTFRSGGWVLLLALLISVYAAFWMLSQRRTLRGDGHNVDTYGFPLTPLLVPRHLIAASGMPKDGLPALLQPHTLSMSELTARNRGYGRFLVGPDKVVGVSVNNEDRAYPLALLLKHEIINDVIGDVPIVISYCPFTESVVVAGRKVNGQILEFHHSGLLYNSNLLLYDQQSDPQRESLWSQLQSRAISGPAAAQGEQLKLLPCALVTWDAWSKQHPNTRVLAPAATLKQEYNYDLYRASDDVIYPVEPLWARLPLKKKTPIVAISANNKWRVAILSEIKRDKTKLTDLQNELGPDAVVSYDDAAETLQVTLANSKMKLPTVYAYLFAWYAQHPETMANLLPPAPKPSPTSTSISPPQQK